MFWPLEHDDLECEHFRVRFTAEAQGGHYILRDFTVQSRTVRSDSSMMRNRITLPLRHVLQHLSLSRKQTHIDKC